MALDPQHLTPDASINRAIITDDPAGNLSPHVRGRQAYDLVSTHALDQLLDAHRDALGLLPEDITHAHRQQFWERLRTQSAPALQIATRLGENLGSLLLTLRRGDATSRAARPEWDESYWAYWAQISHIVLGGGLALPPLGPHIATTATQLLKEHGYAFTIQIARLPLFLPLLGAARHAHADTCVFDFGGTQVKRALACYEAGTLIQLADLGSLPHADALPRNPEMRVRALFEEMVALITQTLAEHNTPGAVIPISIASYIDQGHPMRAIDTGYYVLHRLPAPLAVMLSERLGKRVVLLHDGTAAAAAHAGLPNAAVIQIGTALGVGFPPPSTVGLAPLGPDLR